MPETPLPTLLSQALVACTIELDDEFEQRMPHRTSEHGRTPGVRHAPWLTSYVMWANCVRPLADGPLRYGELVRRVGTETNLPGMQRWGYVTAEPEPGDARAKPPQRDLTVRLTRAGRKADEVWRPLPELVEQRWQQRFGGVDDMKSALSTLVGKFDVGLPDCMPVLGYGLFSAIAHVPPRPADGLSLIALLSRAMAGFAHEYEQDAVLSLAISADVLRVLDEDGVAVRDVPRLGGVSKETVTMATGFLGKKQLIVIEPDSDGKTKVVRLTEGGVRAKAGCLRRIERIEADWRARFGADVVSAVAESLDRVNDRLLDGIPEYPDGWRARVRKPGTLPHFPMVSHRGGFPDGS